MKYEFTIYGQPRPKGRPRFGNGRTFTPAATVAYERLVKTVAKAAGVRPLSGEVALSIEFFLKDRRRCDLSNLCKGIEDGLNGVAYADDSQITHAHFSKHLDRANPRAVVVIESRGE